MGVPKAKWVEEGALPDVWPTLHYETATQRVMYTVDGKSIEVASDFPTAMARYDDFKMPDFLRKDYVAPPKPKTPYQLAMEEIEAIERGAGLDPAIFREKPWYDRPREEIRGFPWRGVMLILVAIFLTAALALSHGGTPTMVLLTASLSLLPILLVASDVPGLSEAPEFVEQGLVDARKANKQVPTMSAGPR